MIYLNEVDIKTIGTNWKQTVEVIKHVVCCIAEQDYAQPVKPYLRYREPQNRIIAMPAFVGGTIDIAGIKWIASFPNNVQKNIPRAHSVVVLNDTETGKPLAIINTALLSVIRTVSVSGLMLEYFDKVKQLKSAKLGIIGWGPIGQNHLKMVMELYGFKISQIFLYDIRSIIRKEDISPPYRDKVIVAKDWREVYENADIFITCTVSEKPYINEKPKRGSILLNVSLRDFQSNIYKYVKNSIVVDNWEEVCRENTDIERMHNEKGLSKECVKTLTDIVCKDGLENFQSDSPIMFNPMGMAVFDIAIGHYYMRLANSGQIGVRLS